VRKKSRVVTILITAAVTFGAFGGIAAAANAKSDGHANTPTTASGKSKEDSNDPSAADDSSSDGAKAGPNPKATFGLCNAYLHGEGGTKGKKANARAFTALAAANALSTPASMKTFCEAVVAAHTSGT
jgi:hypothetical protein